MPLRAKTVIYQSMTIFKGVETMDSGAPLQTVIDWSMTVSVDTKWREVHLYKTVIDWSMTVSVDTKWRDVHLYKTVIDQSMTVSVDTKWGNVHLYKIVIDWSMTIFSVMGMDYQRKLSLTIQ